MALIRWEPAAGSRSIQREFDRLFGTLFDTPTTGVAARRFIPAIDLVEDGDHYVLRADLPGVSESDVEVQVDERVLTVSGTRSSEREQRGQGYQRIERASGRFSRSLTLPEGVAPEAIEANFSNGVLEVRIPKPEQRKPHRVAIGSAGSGAIEGESPAGAEPADGEPAA